MAHSVCIVSPGNLTSNPRVVKEADALFAAGYRVTAVVCDYTDALRDFDDEIVRRAPWTVHRVARPVAGRFTRWAASHLAHVLSVLGLEIPLSVAAAAYGGPGGELRRAALSVPADLYIAHYVAALPAAQAAAQKHDGALGFDAEDFHSGEGGEGPDEAFRMKMVERIEGATLSGATHVTAASPLIGEAYAAKYGVAPLSLLNVFPLAMAPSTVSPSAEPGTIKAYWFSQTVGLDRGLQPFLQAMARTRAKVTLDIRGSDRWGHGATLMAMARETGIGDRVRLLPMASSDQMVELAVPYDLGLSLETDVTQSRRLCLTNKIFTYLLAGIPTMMSDTPAQRAFAPDLGAAARLVPLSDPVEIARTLDELADAPQALNEAKATANRLGRERYNWDVEQRVLLKSVASALDRRSHA